MDVTKSINHHAQPNSLAVLNARKTQASSAWNATLNRASGGIANNVDPFMGIAASERTPNNAKLADSTFELAKSAFSKALNEAGEKRKGLSDGEKAKLEASSQTLVNQFFMGSMLKQMRESPFKSEMLNGGKGGEAYAGMFDQQLAEHAGNRVAKSLVRSMVKQYERTAGGVTATADVTGGAS